MKNLYNIRVYGILINAADEILVTDEFRMGMNMTKFPGGGLEAGEGLIDALKREWQEELAVEIEIQAHFYTTDNYIKSAFNNLQLLSIYYLVQLKEKVEIPVVERPFTFASRIDGAQCFRWIRRSKLAEKDFTFPIDKKVALMLKTIK